MKTMPDKRFSDLELQPLSGYDLSEEVMELVQESRAGLESLLGKELTALEVYQMSFDKGSHQPEE